MKACPEIPLSLKTSESKWQLDPKIITFSVWKKGVLIVFYLCKETIPAHSFFSGESFQAESSMQLFCDKLRVGREGKKY